jgi:hypothetical protein
MLHIQSSALSGDAVCAPAAALRQIHQASAAGRYGSYCGFVDLKDYLLNAWHISSFTIQADKETDEED